MKTVFAAFAALGLSASLATASDLNLPNHHIRTFLHSAQSYHSWGPASSFQDAKGCEEVC